MTVPPTRKDRPVSRWMRRRRRELAEVGMAELLPPARAITEEEQAAEMTADEVTHTELRPYPKPRVIFYTVASPTAGDPLTSPLPDGLIMVAPLIFDSLACPSVLDGRRCERLAVHPRRGGHSTGTGWHAHSADWQADLGQPVVRWRDQKVA